MIDGLSKEERPHRRKYFRWEKWLLGVILRGIRWLSMKNLRIEFADFSKSE